MKSINHNFELRSKQALFSDHLFIQRKGELRMGDAMKERSTTARFVVLGISEAIGPFANYGRTGAERAFAAFMTHFLAWPYQNQSIDVLGNIVFIGNFPEGVQEASTLVEELDLFVEEVLSTIPNNQTPFVIGGGHNNALPLMRWASKRHNPLNILNIDAHTDCRDTNRRHSGNSFSYALNENRIQKYHAIGIHQGVLTDFMKEFIDKNQVFYTFYESYLKGERNLIEDVNQILSSQRATGFEIDMDCIANMPSSASSPSGWRLDDLRAMILQLKSPNLAYVHLTESAIMEASQERQVGRSLVYLLLDFIRVMESQ